MTAGMFLDGSWRAVIFGPEGDNEAAQIGQRLGVQYLKAVQESVEVSIEEHTITVHQDSMGLVAIAGAVWDAGMYMVDFLTTWKEQSEAATAHIAATQSPQSTTSDASAAAPPQFRLGDTLDLGCGTGISGLAAALLGAEKVVFSDSVRLNCFDENIDEITAIDSDLQQKVEFVLYDWFSTEVPPELFLCSKNSDETDSSSSSSSSSSGILGGGMYKWDTVLCSDVVYEEKIHAPLLRVLRTVPFKQLLLAYKKRRDEVDVKFFSELEKFCDIKVVNPACVRLKNLPAASLAELYICFVTPLSIS